MTSLHDKSESHSNSVALAESLRATLGKFVRGVKLQAETPTTSQSETLVLLDTSEPLTVAELAEHRSVRHQSMRLVVSHLEAEGLIRRTDNPADGRSHHLWITEKGRDELSRARTARTLRIAALIDERLSQTERETLNAAISVIDRLC